MSIGVAGQYEFLFSVKGKDDFIHGQNLELFSLFTETGNSLPSYKLVFSSSDVDQFKFIQEINELTIAYGEGSGFVGTPSVWTISKRVIQRMGDSKYSMTLLGIFHTIPFITQQRIYITDFISSIEAIDEIASKSFFTDVKTGSADAQHWIQPNITDKSFIDDIARYSYVGADNFLITAITEYGFFKIYDGLSTLAQGPIFTIGYDSKIAEKVITEGYTYKSYSGFMSCWQGKDRAKIIFRITEGVTEPTITEFTSLNPKDERMPLLGFRADRSGYHAVDNMHEDFYKAETINKAGPAYFSNNTITCSYVVQTLDAVQVLDTVEFFDDELDSLKERPNETISGIWIVGKITMNISRDSFIKTLILYRPNNN